MCVCGSPVCAGRYVASMSNVNELTDCAIINGDLAIQLSGRSKMHSISAFDKR